jgi:hypothetical protein
MIASTAIVISRGRRLALRGEGVAFMPWRS